MIATRFFLIVSIVSLFSLGMGIAFAETESFTVAARDYERKYIDLKEGDDIEYAITVSGGANDDVNFTIYYPDGSNDGGGRISGNFDDKFVAQTSGRYVFEFDNTSSLLSNKSVKFSYDITKNTYYVYVDELPDWAPYAENVISDSIKFWEASYPKLNFHVVSTPQEADFTIKWTKDFGQEHVGYAVGSQFIEVGLGDSNCLKKWNPYSAKHVESIMKHEIGHILGLEHSNNPDDIMYPYTQDTEYGSIELDVVLKSKTLFVPICTSKDLSTFDYWVKTSNENSGFDVFFVPSGDELTNWSEKQSLRHYDDTKCFGKGYTSYGGTCEGVKKGSGLFIMTDKSDIPLDINVKLQEVSNVSSPTRESETVVYQYEEPITPKIEQDHKQIFSENQDSVKEQGKVVCGEGTILKDGKCVVSQQQNPSGGGCLIATATYGSELAPQVQQLRELRDNSLLQTDSGTSFMKSFNQFYYSFSPTIADWERENPAFKEFVKISLTPMISSLSILNYVDMDSESKVLGYGLGLIMLNGVMYVGLPIIGVISLRKTIN